MTRHHPEIRLPDPVPGRILIIDDDPLTLEAFSRYLEHRGFQVQVADNGEDGIKLCREQKPNIILMDASMPGLNGFETCALIKQEANLKDIPIIMVTGLEDEASVNKAFAAGAEEYITKPVNWPVLEQRLRLLLQHRKAEQERQEFIAELARSNRDLEDFAHVVSHDLKEPLNLIQAICGRLENKYAEQLNDKGHEYLRRIRMSAERMQHLISDLLSYARISTDNQPWQEVELEALLQTIVDDLETELQTINGRVTIGKMPVLAADPVLLEQLFRNLFNNAIKYRDPERELQIRIEARLVEGEEENSKNWEIAFHDNGSGFDNQHREKIFAMFQRLENRSNQPGTGIGLAICRRIAEQHQGRITAQSSPGRGSSFFLTLPNRHD